MKFLIKVFLFILSLVIGFIVTIFIYFKIEKEDVNKIISPIINSEMSLFNAPSDSLKGQITNLSGNVLWTARDNTQTLITNSQNIQQGEDLETGTNSKAKINFNNIVNISIDSNSKFEIIQTLPANLVFNQPVGLISYEKLNSNIPISLRALDLLININSGISTIKVNKDKKTVTINVKSGNITLAFTDTNNNTVTQNINNNEEIFFDNNTKKLSFN